MTRLPTLCLALLLPTLALAAPASPDTAAWLVGTPAGAALESLPFSAAQDAQPADAAATAVSALMADATTAGRADQARPAAFSRPADAVRAPDRSGQLTDTRGTITPLAIPEPGTFALAGLALALMGCRKRPLRG